MPLPAIPDQPALTLRNATVPACLIGQAGDLVRTDLSIHDGRIADAVGPSVDLAGAMVLPAFVDMHCHLDKGHIWPRAANPDGTFMRALETVMADREAHWKAEDVRRRMDFALRCAYAHGTRAIRTHIDSRPPQHRISFPVFVEMRQRWAGRIDLQASCLLSVEEADTAHGFDDVADAVEQSGAVLGCVTYPLDDLVARLRHFLEIAGNRGLDVDFHVDETNDPTSATLRTIAEIVRDTGFAGSVVVGHCCSLAVQDESDALATLDLVAAVGLNVVSLPMCNLYLQDRRAGRTPRWRGITLVQEMRERGINVSFASDNTRDPFYAYGDLDMIEVLREATRIGHLDHGAHDWARAFTANPATACGFAVSALTAGSPADLVICNARNWSELLARPQADRIVLRHGRTIDRTLPDYAELDDLWENA